MPFWKGTNNRAHMVCLDAACSFVAYSWTIELVRLPHCIATEKLLDMAFRFTHKKNGSKWQVGVAQLLKSILYTILCTNLLEYSMGIRIPKY